MQAIYNQAEPTELCWYECGGEPKGPDSYFLLGHDDAREYLLNQLHRNEGKVRLLGYFSGKRGKNHIASLLHLKQWH